MWSIPPGIIEDVAVRHSPSGLSPLEREVLQALSDEFVSTTVVKCRARLPINQRNGPTLQACIGLRNRGLAESMGAGLSLRWRRRATGENAAVQNREPATA